MSSFDIDLIEHEYQASGAWPSRRHILLNSLKKAEESRSWRQESWSMKFMDCLGYKTTVEFGYSKQPMVCDAITSRYWEVLIIY